MGATKIVKLNMTSVELLKKVLEEKFEMGNIEIVAPEDEAKGKKLSCHLYEKNMNDAILVVRQKDIHYKGKKGSYSDMGVSRGADGKLQLHQDIHNLGGDTKQVEELVKEMEGAIGKEYSKTEIEPLIAKVQSVSSEPLQQGWEVAPSIDPKTGEEIKFEQLAVDIPLEEYEKLKGDPLLQGIQLA